MPAENPPTKLLLLKPQVPPLGYLDPLVSVGEKMIRSGNDGEAQCVGTGNSLGVQGLGFRAQGASNPDPNFGALGPNYLNAYCSTSLNVQ